MTYATSLARLQSYWNSAPFNASTNPGGMADGGHRQVTVGTDRNFDVLMADIATVASEGVGSVDAALAATGLALLFTWDADTADSDQGSGKAWINDTTAGTATVAFISDADKDGTDRTGLYSRFGASTSTVKGLLGLVKVGDTSKYIYANVTGTTDAAGYYKLALASVSASGSTPFTAGDTVVMAFLRNGDKGETGALELTMGTLTGSVDADGYDITGIDDLEADTVTAGTASVADLSVEWATASQAGETAVERSRDVSGEVIMTSRSAPVMAINLTGDTTLLVAGPESVTPPNLLLRSDDMRTAAEAGEASRPWSSNSSTVRLAAAVGPDGRMTMSHLIEAAASAIHLRGQVATGVAPSQTLTVSVPVGSASGNRNILIKVYDSDASGNAIDVIVNPATGAVVSAAANSGNASGATVAVTALPNGRYRVDLTGVPNTSGSNTAIQVMLANGSSVDYLGDGTSGVYIGRVQLSIGQPQADLWRTGASLNDWSYQRELRITQGGSGGYAFAILPPDLLIYVNDFDNAAWTKGAATITANAAIGPRGTLAMDKLVEDNTNGQHYVTRPVSCASSTMYTMSVYAKAGERTRLTMIDWGFAGAASGTFDLSAGTVVVPGVNAVRVSIEHIWGGIYRCRVTWVTGAAQSTISPRIRLVQSGTTDTYTGDNSSGLYLWGAQLVRGSEPLGHVSIGATRAGVVSWRIADDEVDFPAQAAGVETRLLIDVTPDAILIDDVSLVS